MTRITTYALVALTVVIITASYGSEISQEIVQQFQKNPDQTCHIVEPIADAINNLTVPIGAQHRNETVWRATAPDDFHAVLALMQAVNVTPCDIPAGQAASLSIRAIRLIERNPETGEERIVSEVTDFRDESGDFVFDGELYPSIPTWYAGTPSEPSSQLSIEDNGALTIDLSHTPRALYHGWTDPKVEAKPGMNYLVEMEVKMSGLVRLQMGIDYWREKNSVFNGFDQNCTTSNNCEGHLSNWFGPADDWQVLRTPKALLGNK